MKSISHIFVATGMFAIVAMAPQPVAARSSDADRIALLRDVIVLLEAKLAVLQQQIGVQANDASYPLEPALFRDDDSFLESIDAQIIARYRITEQAIQTPAASHQAYVDRLFELLPEEYHEYFVEFVVFETSDDWVDAFVETMLPYRSQWRYGINETIFADPISDPFQSELLVHEFAHVFSMHEVFTATNQPRTCHEFFTESGCVSPDTMYGKFLSQFWSEEKLDTVLAISESRNRTRDIERFYTRNQDSFVTAYAASQPAEDFAESFAHFVLYDDESFGVIADQKIQFFNRFSKSRALKSEILSDL